MITQIEVIHFTKILANSYLIIVHIKSSVLPNYCNLFQHGILENFLMKINNLSLPKTVLHCTFDSYFLTPKFVIIPIIGQELLILQLLLRYTILHTWYTDISVNKLEMNSQIHHTLFHPVSLWWIPVHCFSADPCILQPMRRSSL